MKIMKCGNCGAKEHQLWRYEKKDVIVVECLKCKNRSKICITNTEPKLTVDWIDGFGGIVTVFE